MLKFFCVWKSQISRAVGSICSLLIERSRKCFQLLTFSATKGLFIWMRASPGTRAGSHPRSRWISPRVYMKLTWRASSSCSNFFGRKQLHIWKLVPYMGVVCAFWIILITCACVFAKFPALLAGLALPVAFIWKLPSPFTRGLRSHEAGPRLGWPARFAYKRNMKFSRKF
jgi:hypothetical protein